MSLTHSSLLSLSRFSQKEPTTTFKMPATRLAFRLLVLAKGSKDAGRRAGGFFLCLEIFSLRMAKSPGRGFREALGIDGMMKRPSRGQSGPWHCHSFGCLQHPSHREGAATSSGWLFSLSRNIFPQNGKVPGQYLPGGSRARVGRKWGCQAPASRLTVLIVDWQVRAGSMRYAGAFLLAAIGT